MAFAKSSATASAFSGGGAGTTPDPFEIYTCSQLQEISSNLSAHYELMDDINCTGFSYTPIGTIGTPFTGSLDGNMQTISHISITSGSNIGIFGITSAATIKNLTLHNNSITGTASAGTITGVANGGTIKNIRADATNTVSGSGGNIGGLVGGVESGSLTVSRVHFDGTVTMSGGAYGGGLIGYGGSSITLEDSYATGTVNGGAAYVGGLLGSQNSGTLLIRRSYSAATLAGSGLSYGGLIGGFFGGTVENSFSASDLTGSVAANTGGLYGVGNGTSTNNFFDRHLAGTIASCADSGSASCTAVNVGNATPDYFKSNSTNPPLDTWNFAYLWENYQKLPEFSVFGAVQTDTPETTSSTINFGYQFSALGGAGPLSSPQLRYRVNGSGGPWTYVAITSSNFDYTLTGLLPGTTYEIQMRAYFDGVDEPMNWNEASFTATTLGASTVASTAQQTQLAKAGLSATVVIASVLHFSVSTTICYYCWRKTRLTV